MAGFSDKMAGMDNRPVIARFFSFVDQTSYCWLWTGFKDDEGYGRFWWKGRNMGAHRWAFEYFRFAIPEGFEIDHLCRNTSCVNPDHLDAVTHLTNMHRSGRAPQTHCAKGHEFTPENIGVRKYKGANRRPERRCLRCHREKEYARRRVNL